MPSSCAGASATEETHPFVARFASGEREISTSVSERRNGNADVN